MGAVSGVLAGIGLVTSLIGRQKQQQAQQQALDLRLQQQEAANVERSVKRGRRLNEVMAAQVAREGASGLSLSSPSFFAVGENSFNQFAEDENADALNLSFDKISAMNQSQSIRDQEKFGMMGDVFSAGTSVFNAGVFKSTSGQGPVAQTQRPQTKGSDPFLPPPPGDFIL